MSENKYRDPEYVQGQIGALQAAVKTIIEGGSVPQIPYEGAAADVLRKADPEWEKGASSKYHEGFKDIWEALQG